MNKKILILIPILTLFFIGYSAMAEDVGIGTINPWRITGQDITPRNTAYGLKMLGVASSTTGCLTITSTGLISPTGSACGVGAGSGSSFGKSWEINNSSKLTATTTIDVFAPADLYVGGGDFFLGTGLASTTISGNGIGIGIGTTTPGSILSISGTANFTSATSTFYSGLLAYNTIQSTGLIATSTLYVGGTTGTSLIVTNAGNVGIGTTTPNNKLDIYSTTKSAIGFSGASGDTYKWTMGMDVTNGGRFSIASSTALGTLDRFVIDGSGNVGIGTVVPSSKLTLYDDTAGDVAFLKLQHATNYGANLGVNTSVTGDFFIQTVIAGSATKRLTIQRADGNVGIGTTSPFGLLSLGATQNVYPFIIASTTASQASSTLFAIDKNADVHYGGGTPMLSSCGTNPLLDANSTDQAGTVTFGATASGCTITFSIQKLSSPHCIVSTRAVSLVNAYTVAVSASAFTITQAASGGVSFDYFCPLGH